MRCRPRFLKKQVDYVLDADIRGFFDDLDQSWLIKSSSIASLIPASFRLTQQWLEAPVIEEEQIIEHEGRTVHKVR